MEDVQKLKKLAIHWKEHNSDHAGSYNEWSDKMKVVGRDKASEILRQIARRTIELNDLFDDLVRDLA